MRPNVTVYVPSTACHKCNITKVALRKGDIPFAEVIADQQTVDRFVSEGHASFPIVAVDGGPTWSDLRLDKIKKLADSIR